MFCVDTVEGRIEPKLALVRSWLAWARPNGLSLPYYVKTDYQGKTGAAIKVTINGQEAASFSEKERR